MAKSVVGLYDSPEKARDVVNGLVQAGCRRDDISLVAREREEGGLGIEPEQKTEQGDKSAEGLAAGAGIGAVLGGIGGVLVGLGTLAIPGIGPLLAAGPIVGGLVGAAGGAVAGGLIGGLIGLGIPEEEAHAYAEGVRRGHTLVIARVDDEQAPEAERVMNRFGPLDIHTEAERWRNQGWSGRFDENAAAIPVAEEQLAVGKRQVEAGGVRVHSHVVEQPVEATVHLQQERVQVERMPVDRPLSDADRAFQERTIEATESREEPVVSKTARVTEEVRLSKEQEEEQRRIRDTVRKTEVDVDKRPDR